MAGLATATCPFKPSSSSALSHGSSPSPRAPPYLALRSSHPCGALTAVLLARRGVPTTAARRQELDVDPDVDLDPDAAALDLSRITSTVRLIDENQNMVGIIPKDQAIRMADDAEKDLVIMSPNADPPVVKIMDYGKYKFEQKKKKKENLRKSVVKRVETKELKMGFKTDDHDYSVRLKAAEKFLKEGDKVKIIITLKGRENRFKNEAVEIFKRFERDVGEFAKVERKDFSGKAIFIVLSAGKKTKGEGHSKEQPKLVEERAPANEFDALILERYPPGYFADFLEQQNVGGEK